MKLTGLIDGIEVRNGDDRNDGTKSWACTPCGAQVTGRRNHCAACHTTFASMKDFDSHRVGKYENRATGRANTRRCLTRDEMRGDGWTEHGHGLWRSPVKESA